MNVNRNIKHFSFKIVKLDINSILSNVTTKQTNCSIKQNLIHYYPVSNKYFNEMSNDSCVKDINDGNSNNTTR